MNTLSTGGKITLFAVALFIGCYFYGSSIPVQERAMLQVAQRQAQYQQLPQITSTTSDQVIDAVKGVWSEELHQDGYTVTLFRKDKQIQLDMLINGTVVPLYSINDPRYAGIDITNQIQSWKIKLSDNQTVGSTKVKIHKERT